VLSSLQPHLVIVNVAGGDDDSERCMVLVLVSRGHFAALLSTSCLLSFPLIVVYFSFFMRADITSFLTDAAAVDRT